VFSLPGVGMTPLQFSLTGVGVTVVAPVAALAAELANAAGTHSNTRRRDTSVARLRRAWRRTSAHTMRTATRARRQPEPAWVLRLLGGRTARAASTVFDGGHQGS